MSTPKVTYAQHNYTSVNLLGITFSELRSCVKVDVAVLGSCPLYKPTVCVDVKQHLSNSK